MITKNSEGLKFFLINAGISLLYGLALNERIAKIGQLWNSFHRSGMKTWNFEMTIICSIILFITWSFSFLNAIRISKVPGHYINRKIQYSTARTAVLLFFYLGASGGFWTEIGIILISIHLYSRNRDIEMLTTNELSCFV